MMTDSVVTAGEKSGSDFFDPSLIPKKGRNPYDNPVFYKTFDTP